MLGSIHGDLTTGRNLVIESCASRWSFDLDRSRFRRVPRAVTSDLDAPESEWMQYTDLVLEQGGPGFTVVLDDSGSRLLHSTRHRPGCTRCGTDETTEMLLDLREPT